LQAAAGGGELKLTDRWIRELAERIGDKGDKAVIHGLRGAGSKRQIAASRETVRQWMLRAGAWKRRKQRIEDFTILRSPTRAAPQHPGVEYTAHPASRMSAPRTSTVRDLYVFDTGLG
jgi:hypothetical protein